MMVMVCESNIMHRLHQTGPTLEKKRQRKRRNGHFHVAMEPRDPRRHHAASSASEPPLTLPPINPRRIPAQVDEPDVILQ